MSAGGTSDQATDVACPFCGLICDDLVVEAKPAGLEVAANGCPRSSAGFGRTPEPDEPRVGGKPASRQQAVARAAEILADARLPLFAGLGADVAGIRAILALADRLGGVVDHIGSAALFRNLRTVQEDGWMTATLSEVRNRVDLLVVFGSGIASGFPRFFERCVWPSETLFGGDIRQRQVVLVAAGANDVAAAKDAARAAGAIEPIAIDSGADDLPAVVAALRAVLNGRTIPADAGAAEPGALHGLAERMRRAEYGVAAWTAGGLDGAAGELTLGVIVDIIRDLNRHTRFSGLPLSGTDNGVGANQVCTWQTGFPVRTSFAAGYPEHEAWCFDAARLAESGEADAIVWVSAFRDDDYPYLGTAPLISLSMPGSRFARDPDVFIPVGTPGLDHAGQVFRTDGVVALPLRSLRKSAHPSVAEAIADIDVAIATQTGYENRAG